MVHWKWPQHARLRNAIIRNQDRSNISENFGTTTVPAGQGRLIQWTVIRDSSSRDGAFDAIQPVGWDRSRRGWRACGVQDSVAPACDGDRTSNATSGVASRSSELGGAV